MPLRALFRIPGVAGPFAAALLGRLPTTALGLLLILHVEGLTNRFSIAGLAAGGYALGLAVSSPLLGRLIDRRGQAAVLPVCATLAAAAIAVVAVLPAGAPPGLVVVLAVPVGMAMPPLGSTLRALWTELPDADARHTAFALDSAAIESAYVLGPLLLVAGLTVAPALNAALVMLGQAAPPGTVTEAFTWSTCAITGGIAAGSSLAGALAEESAQAPFLAVAALGLLAAVVGALRRPALAAVHA